MNQELLSAFAVNIELPVLAVFAAMSVMVLMWKMAKIIFYKPWRQGYRKTVIAYAVMTIIIGVLPMIMSGENAVISLAISMVISMIGTIWYTIWVCEVWTDEDRYAVFIWYVLNPHVWVGEQITTGAYDMYISWRLRK